MGVARSKEPQVHEDPQNHAPDFKLMYYDENGTLRLGKTLRDREAELEAVLKADSKEIEEGEAWFIVDSTWIKAWLGFVHFSKGSPEPGPVDNTRLLSYNTEAGRWEPRPTLKQAGRNMGHYRRVSERVWKLYKELYPGSGPDIWAVSVPFEDVAAWSVDPAWPPPSDGEKEPPKGAGSKEARLGSSNALFSPKKRRKGGDDTSAAGVIAATRAAGIATAAAYDQAGEGATDGFEPDTPAGADIGGRGGYVVGEPSTAEPEDLGGDDLEASAAVPNGFGGIARTAFPSASDLMAGGGGGGDASAEADAAAAREAATSFFGASVPTDESGTAPALPTVDGGGEGGAAGAGAGAADDAWLYG